jgi:hypothetical protein
VGWSVELVLDTVMGVDFVELACPVKGGTDWRHVATLGFLGKLATWSNYLSEWLRWDPSETTRWLICGGKPPQTQSVTVEYQVGAEGFLNTTTRMVLTIDPMLSPAQVARAYTDARRPLVEKQRERVRSIDARTARLAQFILEQSEDIGSPPWELWRKRWNARAFVKSNDWTWGDEKFQWDNFARAVRDAYERLSRAEWHVPREARRGPPHPYQEEW